MKFFNFKRGKKEDVVEHMAVILLRQDEGVGFLCRINHTTNEIEIIDERAFTYANAWENLVYDIDELLFGFEQAHDMQIKKATFFVYSHLVDSVTGELKEPYIRSLKDVISVNKLESLGYIELEESLAHIYSQFEHSPLNAVLVEVDSSSVSVFVYQGGKKIFGNSIAKTEDIVKDLEELFKRTGKEKLLPARILMYDSPTVESESHTILTHTWQDNLFVQIPKVDVVRDVELKQAIVYGLTQELFGDTARFTNVPAGEVEADEADGTEAFDAPEASNEPGKDTVMGFVIGADVNESAHVPQPSAHDVTYEAEPVEVLPQTSRPLSSTIRGMKSSLVAFFKGDNKKKAFIAGVALVCIGGIVAATYAMLYFSHKATLTVFYESQPLTDSVSLTDEKTFTEYKETFKVSAKIDTTGTEDVGEKATGQVTLFNADEEDKTFAKGTKLSTPDGLIFVTDEEVTVEAATKKITDEGDVLASSSKASVGATAVELGEKHNINKDVKLSVEDFSDTTYFARTATAFSGGSSKEVQTVARADYTAIDKQIAAELSKKSKEKLKSLAGKGNIVDELTLIDKQEQTYSKEIAEEATTLTSTVTAHVSFYAYDEDKITSELMKTFSSDVPTGYVLQEDGLDYTIETAVRDKKTGDIRVEIEATAEPELKVDASKLIEAVKGKSLESIRSLLESEFKASGYDAKVSAPLPFLNNQLPWFAQNITVELKPQSK